MGRVTNGHPGRDPLIGSLMRRLRHWKLTVAGVIVSCLLAGCSQTFTYNHLDWLIPWYVDDYVDITRKQKQVLKRHLEPLLRWHREEELVSYIAILDRIEADLQSPVTAGTVMKWVDEVIAASKRIENSMLNMSLDFSTALSDEQMQEFAASIREEQEEYEEEFLPRSDEEYVEENTENLEDFLRDYLGRLSPEQKRRLQQGAREMRRFDAVWLAEHEAWLDTLEPFLQRPEGWQEAVKKAHEQRDQNRPQEYTEILDHNMSVLTGAVADVLNSMSEKQRAKVMREIESQRATIRKLIE